MRPLKVKHLERWLVAKSQSRCAHACQPVSLRRRVSLLAIDPRVSRLTARQTKICQPVECNTCRFSGGRERGWFLLKSLEALKRIVELRKIWTESRAIEPMSLGKQPQLILRANKVRGLGQSNRALLTERLAVLDRNGEKLRTFVAQD